MRIKRLIKILTILAKAEAAGEDLCANGEVCLGKRCIILPWDRSTGDIAHALEEAGCSFDGFYWSILL